jgi:ATP-dependent DNA helicase RecQ
MLALCETVECRRANMLGYFGEHAEPCGNCDTCLAPPRSWDGTIPVQQLLSTVVRLDRERRQRFGFGHLIDILRGKTTARTEQWHHQDLSTWGIGAEISEPAWRSIGRQVLARGDLALSRDGYGTLLITDQGWEVLRGERTVPLREEVVRPSAPSVPRRTSRFEDQEPLDDADSALFDALRAWRREQAKERGVPAYVVFHDATLRQIAQARPATLEALAQISGVGAAKLDAYGTSVLEVLAA